MDSPSLLAQIRGGVNPWTGQGLEVIAFPCCSMLFLLIGVLAGALVAKYANRRTLPVMAAGAIGAVIAAWLAFLPFLVFDQEVHKNAPNMTYAEAVAKGKEEDAKRTRNDGFALAGVFLCAAAGGIIASIAVARLVKPRQPPPL